MSDEVEPYSEPTDEQLISFMEVWTASNPAAQVLGVKPGVMSWVISNNPQAREKALAIHRRFQDAIHAEAQREAANPICSHIRPNGKRCPNYNQPGTYFCGLHQED